MNYLLFDYKKQEVVAEISDPKLARQIEMMAIFVAGENRYYLRRIDQIIMPRNYEWANKWREGITHQDIADTMTPKPGEGG